MAENEEYRLPFLADKIAELLNIVNDLGDWAKAANKPSYTASEVGARPSTWTPSASDVGADPSGTAAGAVSSHNTAADAHEYIRSLIEQITTTVNDISGAIEVTDDRINALIDAKLGVIENGSY